MKIFALWYAYFDTIFLRKNAIPNSTLISMIPTKTQPWPERCSLPQLSQCFSELENFIFEQKNWSESICTIDELNSIEKDVTNVLTLLQIQKLYIIKFWSSKRRVEGSVAHLYAILQIFVGSIIPYHNMTLFECKAANKLCVKIVNLQNLIKSIMSKINTICAYFSDQFFDEQFSILTNFFHNFVAFMQIIPKVKKTKMVHISDLLNLEISAQPLSIPISDHYRNMMFSDEKKYFARNARSLEFVRPNCYMLNGYIFKKRRRAQSCHHLELLAEENNEHYAKTKNLLRFIFPSWIRRHSSKHPKQIIPKPIIQPITKSIKAKSNTEFRKSSYNEQLSRTNRKMSPSKPLVKNKSNTIPDLTLQKRNPRKSTMSPEKATNTSQRYFDQDEENGLIEAPSCILLENDRKCAEMAKYETAPNFSLDSFSFLQKVPRMAQLSCKYQIVHKLKQILQEQD